MEISRMEEEVRKGEEEITRIIKVKEKSALKPLDISSLATEGVDLYPEGTTDEEGTFKDDFIEIGNMPGTCSGKSIYPEGRPSQSDK